MSKSAIFVLFVVALIVSCDESPGPIEKRSIPAPNPTSYVFDRPLQDLRNQVIKAVDDFDAMREFNTDFSLSTIRFFVETSEDDSPISREVFANQTNANDLFLHSYTTPINPPQPVYFSRGKPLEYFADFHIHFETVGDASTRVSVAAHKPRVINGSGCCGAHGEVAVYQDVEPTTVEEYRLLQLIGRIVGEGNMPPINLPDSTN